MIDYIGQYKKALKKHLHCSNTTKQKLIRQFNVLLSQFLLDCPTPTPDELLDAFGPPEDIAQVLMSKVSHSEKSRHHLKIQLLHICITILSAMFIIFSIYTFVLKERPMPVYDEAYEITESIEGGNQE